MDKSIDYVIAVAECRSIHKAAEILYISQPSLSRYISKIEQQLGMALFERTVSGIEMTTAGEVYVYYAKQIKALRSTMQLELQRLTKEKEGRIRVGMTLNSISLVTSEVQRVFGKKYPDCIIEFETIRSIEIAEAINTEVYNYIIGPQVDQNYYDYSEFRRDSMVLAVPLQYNFNHLAEEKEDFPFLWLDLQTVGELDLILQDHNCNIRKEIDELINANSVKVNRKLTVNSSMLAIQGAERQAGCCIISDLFLTYVVYKNRLRYYNIGTKKDYSPSGIISKKGKIFSPQERYSIKTIKSAIQKEHERIIQGFVNIQ